MKKLIIALLLIASTNVVATNETDKDGVHILIVNNVVHYAVSCFLMKENFIGENEPKACAMYIKVMQSEDVKNSVKHLTTAGYNDLVDEFYAYKSTLKAVLGANKIDQKWCYPSCVE